MSLLPPPSFVHGIYRSRLAQDWPGESLILQISQVFINGYAPIIGVGPAQPSVSTEFQTDKSDVLIAYRHHFLPGIDAYRPWVSRGGRSCQPGRRNNY